jgi:hypothetical protein
MGCSTCKQENQSNMVNAISSEMPGGEIYNGHFFLKVATFIALLVAVPLIIVILICQIFLTFFVPSKVNNIKKKFNNFFKKIISKVFSLMVKIKENKILRKQRQFNKTTSYYEEPDIEVFDINDIEDNNDKDSEI